MNTEGSVLGIDVGWSRKRRSSAICRLSWNTQEIEWKICRFSAYDSDRKNAIKHTVDDHELASVAIDGPLQPGFNEIGHYRIAERILSRGELSKQIGKPGQSNSPNGRNLNVQANKSARLVKNLCCIREANYHVRIDKCAIAEAFPTTFLGVMLEDPIVVQGSKERSDRYFVHLANCQHFDRFLEDMLNGRKLMYTPKAIMNHDDRAAFVCALTALCIANEEFVAVGDKKDGWIILPPRRMFADWAWDAICESAERENKEGRLLSF